MTLDEILKKMKEMGLKRVQEYEEKIASLSFSEKEALEKELNSPKIIYPAGWSHFDRMFEDRPKPYYKAASEKDIIDRAMLKFALGLFKPIDLSLTPEEMARICKKEDDMGE